MQSYFLHTLDETNQDGNDTAEELVDISSNKLHTKFEFTHIKNKTKTGPVIFFSILGTVPVPVQLGKIT